MDSETKVYHLPTGGRLAELTEMRDQRLARRLEMKKDKRRRAWIKRLVLFNIIMWSITIIYYLINWEDIFR